MTEIEWNKFDGEYLPTDEDIQNVEKKIGFEFPKDFIEVMKMNDGACPSVRAFDMLDDESCINNLLSFDESAVQSIIFAYHVVQGRGLKNVYPIARDPFGNYLCYKKCKFNKLKIVFWNHEKPKKTTELCHTFSEFLDMLHE